MTPQKPNEIRICPAPADSWSAALRLLFQNLPEDIRTRQLQATLDQFRAEPAAAVGLLEARRGDALVGSAWIQLQRGRVASLWPPQTVAENGPNADAVAQALLSAATELAVRGQARMIQALLRTDVAREAQPVREAGFEHVADLLYLVSPASAFPTAAPVAELSFETFSPTALARFETVAERTYIDTRDCPSLNGVRPVAEVLEGYQAVGHFDPNHWMLVRSGGEDVGCLLLADHAEHGLWELVYMGIVPEARGNGWGLAITRHAQWLARQAHVARLVLAVDAANAPAVGGYAAAGFVAWDRRSVFLKRLP